MIPVLVLLLAASPAPPAWIAAAGGVAQGDSVDLRASWVTDSDMPLLVRMPELKRLDLSATRISDRGLRALRPAAGITDLDLTFAEQVGDEGTSALRNWKHLRRLSLRGTKITDNTLEMLEGVATIESLDIAFAQLTDAGLDHLTALPNLRELSMGGNKLTGAGLDFLRQVPQLRVLDIGGSQRTDSGLWNILLTEPGVDAIGTLAELRAFYANGTALTAPWLRRLSKLSKLERMGLQGCKKIGHDAVPALGQFTSLKWLDVKDTALSPEDVSALGKLLPRTEILH